jgi:hypothetical protein
MFLTMPDDGLAPSKSHADVVVLAHAEVSRELRRQAKYALQDERGAEELHRVREGAQPFPFTGGGSSF